MGPANSTNSSIAIDPNAAKSGTTGLSVIAIVTAKSPGATIAALTDLRSAVRPASRRSRDRRMFTADASQTHPVSRTSL